MTLPTDLAARLAQGLHAGDALVLLFDGDGTVAWANSRALAAFPDAVGRPWSAVGAPPADALAAVLAGLGARQTLPAGVDGAFRGLDGDVPLRWHLSRLPDGGVMALGVEPCEVRAIERTPERDARARHAQKMEALGRLAGGIAHDVNNMLTVVIGAGTQLRGQAERGTPSYEVADELLHAASRGAELMRQLLAFSRRQVVTVRPLDVNRVLSGVARMMRRLISPSVEIVEELDPQLPPALGDAGQIEQVVVNLALNARDAMPSGGRLTFVSRRAATDVPGSPAVEFRVADTGIGMSDAVKAHLFEPFFTTKADGTGTGLGLAMSFGIVEQLGGRIAVDSAPGRGTEVVVALPMARDRSETPASSAERASLEADGEVILFVEDEPLVRRSVARVLRNLGYQVLVADGADQAEALFTDAERVDALVTDIVMPGRSGIELSRALRALRPALPVVFLSGHTADDAVRRELGEGTEHFLDKPFQPKALASTLRTLLEGSRARRGASSTGSIP